METVSQSSAKPYLKLVPDPPVSPVRMALPSRTVDLIRRGLSPSELRGEGARKRIVGALGSTAASAVQHGYGYERWHALVVGDDQPSALAFQYRMSRVGKPETARELDGALRRIWANAERWVAEHPPLYSERQIFRYLDEVRAAVKVSGLGVSDRKVMLTILMIAEGNITVTPAAPRRRVVAASGVGERAVRNGLERLVVGGWLSVVTRGEPRKPVKGAKGMAAIYLVKVPGSVGSGL